MQVSRIDHVHLEVSDRDKAADWYEMILGLKRHPDFKSWAEDPMGPLILEGGDGFPALSLFKRQFKEVSRDSTVAFRVDGGSFINFLTEVASLDLTTTTAGGKLSQNDLVDHEVSWSLYFLDPDQNRIEVTTYDYGMVKEALA